MAVTYKKISIQSAADLPQVEKIGLIGGGELNGSLAALGFIDEIILDVESIALGRSKRLFGGHDVQLNLQHVASQPVGPNTMQNRYKVVKKVL